MNQRQTYTADGYIHALINNILNCWIRLEPNVQLLLSLNNSDIRKWCRLFFSLLLCRKSCTLLMSVTMTHVYRYIWRFCVKAKQMIRGIKLRAHLEIRKLNVEKTIAAMATRARYNQSFQRGRDYFMKNVSGTKSFTAKSSECKPFGCCLVVWLENDNVKEENNFVLEGNNITGPYKLQFSPRKQRRHESCTRHHHFHRCVVVFSQELF